MKKNTTSRSWIIFWALIASSLTFFSFSIIYKADPQKIPPNLPIRLSPLFVDGLWGENRRAGERIGLKKKVTLSPTALPTATVAEERKNESAPTLSSGKIIITTPEPSTTNSNTSKSTSSENRSNEINVTLSINGGPALLLTLSQGSNQCDVLSQALREGKISSLNMRYNTELGTNGIYQINGVGKEDQVWWTYKVNGKSPSQGCSYIKAANNDSIAWKYSGN